MADITKQVTKLSNLKGKAKQQAVNNKQPGHSYLGYKTGSKPTVATMQARSKFLLDGITNGTYGGPSGTLYACAYGAYRATNGWLRNVKKGNSPKSQVLLPEGVTLPVPSSTQTKAA